MQVEGFPKVIKGSELIIHIKLIYKLSWNVQLKYLNSSLAKEKEVSVTLLISSCGKAIKSLNCVFIISMNSFRYSFLCNLI